jgi:putative transposase
MQCGRACQLVSSLPAQRRAASYSSAGGAQRFDYERDDARRPDGEQARPYRTRNEAKAHVFDYIERFYNAARRHPTIGYISPVEFERKVGLA